MRRQPLILTLSATVALVVGIVVAVAISPLSGVGVAVMVCAIGLAIWKPWLGVAVLVGFLPFNGLVSALLSVIHDDRAGLIVGALKDVLLLVLLVLAVLRNRRSIRIDIAVLVGATVLVGAAAGIGTPSLEMAAYGWRNDFEPLLLLVCVPAVLDGLTARRVAITAALAIQLSALISIVTWLIGLPWLTIIHRLPVPPGQPFPTALFTSGNLHPRAFSPFTAPNEMALGVLAVLAMLWCINTLPMKWRIALSVLPVAAIALSQSRSGYIGLVVLAAIVAFFEVRRRRARLARWLGIAAAVAIVGITFYYVKTLLDAGADPSFAGHATSLVQSLALVVQHPFGLGLGEVGPRAIRYLANPTYVESFWLLLALEAGPLALLLFIGLQGRIVQLSASSRSRIANTAVVAIGASLVSQLVLPTLQEASVSYLLWIAVSVGLVGVREERRARRKEGLAPAEPNPEAESAITG